MADASYNLISAFYLLKTSNMPKEINPNWKFRNTLKWNSPKVFGAIKHLKLTKGFVRKVNLELILCYLKSEKKNIYN